MIEVRRVDKSQIRVAPLMFGVAHCTVVHRDLAMDSLFGGDAPCDLFVADQAPVAVDVEIEVVAAVAALGIFKTLVGEIEETRHVVDTEFLTDRGNRAKGQHESQKDGPESPRIFPSDVRISLAVMGCQRGRRGVFTVWGWTRIHRLAENIRNRDCGFRSLHCGPSFHLLGHPLSVSHVRTCFSNQM